MSNHYITIITYILSHVIDSSAMWTLAPHGIYKHFDPVFIYRLMVLLIKFN